MKDIGQSFLLQTNLFYSPFLWCNFVSSSYAIESPEKASPEEIFTHIQSLLDIDGRNGFTYYPSPEAKAPS
jgi:hypothetical protein